MTNYNDGKWHGWNGGECPVHPKSLIQALRGDYEGARAVTWVASEFHQCNWTDTEKVHSIIAFRVIKEHREPREWWMIGKSPMDTLEKAKEFLEELGNEHPGLDFGPIIHVREVL